IGYSPYSSVTTPVSRVPFCTTFMLTALVPLGTTNWTRHCPAAPDAANRDTKTSATNRIIVEQTFYLRSAGAGSLGHASRRDAAHRVGRGRPRAPLRRAALLQVLGDRRLRAVDRPPERRRVPDALANVRPRSPVDQRADDVEVTRGGGGMQRRRVRAQRRRVVPAGIFAGVQQQPHQGRMAELGGERQRAMSILRSG